MKKLILSLSFLASFSTQAAGVSTGIVTDVYPMANGVVFVVSSAASTGQPSCPSLQPSWYAVDGTTVAGQRQLEWLRQAKALGLTVTFYGTGACNLNSAVETLNYPKVHQ